MIKQHDVFLSYSRKDTPHMIQVRDALRADGVVVWTDEYLEPGTSAWVRSLEQAIKESKTLIVLLSPDSSASDWVLREITLAQKRNLKIFPVVIKGDSSEDVVPMQLITHQWIDARTDFNQQLNRLKQSILNAVNKKSYEQILQELNTVNKQLQAERDSFAHEKATLLLNLEQLQQSIEDMATSIPHLETIERENNELKQACVELISKYETAKKTINTLEKRPSEATIQGFHKNIADFQIQVDELTKENKSLKKQIQISEDTATPWISWSYSVIGAIIILIILFGQPSIEILVDGLGGYVFGIPPQLYSIPAFILLGSNLWLGNIKTNGDGYWTIIYMMSSILWCLILLGLLPDDWLGMISHILIFLIILFVPHFIASSSNQSLDSGADFFISNWLGFLTGIFILSIIGLYAILHPALSSYFNGILLRLLKIAFAIAFPSILIGVIGWVFFKLMGSLDKINDDLADTFLQVVSFLISFTSIFIFIWLYLFNGWQLLA